MEFYSVKNVSKVGDSSLYINIQSGIQNYPVNDSQPAALLHQMQPKGNIWELLSKEGEKKKKKKKIK